jgi:hypothetical protein
MHPSTNPKFCYGGKEPGTATFWHDGESVQIPVEVIEEYISLLKRLRGTAVVSKPQEKVAIAL